MNDAQLQSILTKPQYETYKAVCAQGSNRKAARILGVGHTSVDVTMKRARQRLAAAGFSPDHDMTETVPSPFLVKGVSSLYKVHPDGSKELRTQWVKSKVDDQLRMQAIEAAITEACKSIKPLARKKAPKTGSKDILNLITMTDCHIGMKAWDEECGENWDLKIAERQLTECFANLLDRSPSAQTCVIAQLGDFLHYDGLNPVTPLHGHILDADSRFSKMVKTAIRVLRRVVELALEKHDKVVIVIAEGNHDIASSVWLRHMFLALYENEPRVELINNELPYYAHQFGKVMLAWHHSHLSQMEKLDRVFAARYAEMWGQTTHRFCHTGDKHHQRELDSFGMTVIQHATLAAADAYAARHGYFSTRKASLITYHKDHGEVGRVIVHPAMLG